MPKLRILLVLCLIAISSPAQVLYGSLTGNVTDSSNAAIPGAKVLAVNTNTGVERQAVTDERGAFVFNDLQTGLYRVTISAPAFSIVEQTGVRIDGNTLRRIDVSLKVSQISESISVSASGISLQTDRADVNVQLERGQIAELPIGAGRNFQNLYKTIPGFSPPADAHSDAGNPQRALISNVNGTSYSNNNTRLDGATVSYPWLPHIVAYVPPADAIETVNIVTNAFDAEQGMAGGAAVNVSIKSGTNQFHGSLHEFHTNSKLKARPYFYCLYSCSGDPNRLPKNILNQYGGTIGGPIVKNKLFFFADWERTQRRQTAAAFRTIPTSALRAGNFAGTGATIFDPTTGATDGSNRQPFANNQVPATRFDPASVKMASLIPQPAGTALNNNYLATGTYQFNRINSDIKVNYNPTDKSSIFGRYSISPSQLFDPPSLGEALGDATNGGQPGNAPGRIQSASIGGTYTLTPRILIDGNIGWTRQRLGAENIDLGSNYGLDVLKIPGTNGPDRLQGGIPRFSFNTFSSIGNPNVSNPFLFRDNQYVAVVNTGVIRGAHSIRFGYEYARYEINHFQPQASNGPRGGFNFSGGLTALRGGAAPISFYSWADFMLGLPTSMGKDVQYINPATVRMPSQGMYIRDQWQVSRRLTLNYGIRYEFYPFATRDHRGFERYDVATDRILIGGVGSTPRDTGVDVGKGQLAPRLGIAYRVSNRLVVRTGYGISIDPNSYRQMRDAFPATISTQYSGNSTFEAAGSLRTGIPEVVGPPLNQGTLTMPVAVGTVTYPTRFNRGYIQSYNFMVQGDLGQGFNLEGGYVGSRSIRSIAALNINAAQGFGLGNAQRALFPTTGRIANITMYAPFNTSTYNSFQSQLRKRLAGGSTFGLSYTFSKAISYGDNSDSGLSWNWVQMWNRNKALAGFDRTHNFQMYAVYELPFGKGRQFATSGLLSQIAGGWQLNGIISRTSGTPFTVGAAGTSVNSPGNAQTADQVTPTVKILGGHGTGQPYFDPNAFVPVTEVRFGNSGRNTLRGPGFFNTDAGITRTFSLTERFRLQFRAESFGLTNTPQFGGVGTTASNALRNPDGAVRSLGSLNGYSEILSASGERQFQLSLKLIF